MDHVVKQLNFKLDNVEFQKYTLFHNKYYIVQYEFQDFQIGAYLWNETFSILKNDIDTLRMYENLSISLNSRKLFKDAISHQNIIIMECNFNLHLYNGV